MTTGDRHESEDEDANRWPRGNHPVDQLIRELADGAAPIAEGNVDRIIAHIAVAPFDDRVVPVRLKYRGLHYLGNTLTNREPSLRLHLVQRVVSDEHWADGTTARSYLADLHEAVRDPLARLVVYFRRDGYMAGVLAPNTLPASRRGPNALDWIFVGYSADRGTIVTGYQASGLATISTSEDARWLR